MGFWVLLALFVASWVIGDLLKPSRKTGSKAGQAQPPQADEGGVIPVVFGTCKLGVNATWYGDLWADPRTIKQKTGIFSTQTTVIGYAYHVGLQTMLCHGPVDAIEDVVFDNTKSLKEEENRRQIIGYDFLGQPVYGPITSYVVAPTDQDFPVLKTNVAAGGATTFTIDAMGLLGGEDQNGGVKGTMSFYYGTDTQTKNSYLNAKVPFAGTLLSDYRGFCYAVWHQTLIGYSPSLPNIEFVVRRCPSNLAQPGTANIDGDANPAEVIYECLTNSVWGVGMPTTFIDANSFRAVATALYNEGMGVSIQINSGTSTDEFIREILRHIDGVIVRNPLTGAFTLKIARRDYTLASLEVFDESNTSELQWIRGSFLQTINEVKVVYQNREMGFKEKVAIAQNLANQQATGRTRSETIDFVGISKPGVAQNVAERSLRALSGSTARCRAISNRKAASLSPGDVVKVSWAKYGISQAIVRVTRITGGSLEDGRIEWEGAEDIYGLTDEVFIPPPALGEADPVSLLVNPPKDPAILDVTGTTALLRWVTAANAFGTEIFVVAGAVASTAAVNRVAYLDPDKTQLALGSLSNSTTYTASIIHTDAKGAVSTPVSVTFTTNVAATSLPRPAAIDIVRVNDADTGNAATPFGIIVGLYPANAALDFSILRAPDSGGAPNVGAAVEVGRALGNDTYWTDALPNDGTTRWYSVRHAIGVSYSTQTKWVSAVPRHIPATVERPLPIDVQVDDSLSTETNTQGALALAIQDPQGRVLTIEMAAKSGSAAWGGWSEVTSLTVPLVEKQTSAIRYRVAAYDSLNILRTYMFGSSVNFVAGANPTIPTIQSLTFDASGNLEAILTGDSDTQSLKFTALASVDPTLTQIRAATAANGRSSVYTSGPYTEGTTVHVGVLAYSDTGAGGVESVVAYGHIRRLSAGATGPAGNQGPTGVAGVQGPQGEGGVTGPQGPEGATGIQGVQGIQGIGGVTGPVGPQGSTGVIGPQGVQGIGGVTGPQGNVGATGIQGVQGIQGIAGATGVQGPTGAPGPTGVVGQTGLVGANWRGSWSGAATYLEDDLVQYLGVTYIARPGGSTNQQPPNVTYWDLVAEKGQSGPIGPTGAQGIQGIQGPTGAQGIQGPQGAVGNTGSPGAQGSTGAQGIQGTQGPVGNQGPVGANGSTGAQGIQGPQGAVGNTGSQGPQGSAGIQGIQGPQGAVGNQGPIGAQGPTGPNTPVTVVRVEGSGSQSIANLIVTGVSYPVTVDDALDLHRGEGYWGGSQDLSAIHLDEANIGGVWIFMATINWGFGSTGTRTLRLTRQQGGTFWTIAEILNPAAAVSGGFQMITGMLTGWSQYDRVYADCQHSQGVALSATGGKFHGVHLRG